MRDLIDFLMFAMKIEAHDFTLAAQCLARRGLIPSKRSAQWSVLTLSLSTTIWALVTQNIVLRSNSTHSL
jgi:hypothetical protein